MKVVSVATLDSRAYYSILNRLKSTNLRFVSLTPAQAQFEKFEVVITTSREREFFEGTGTSIPIEELDENPLIMEGQILSRILTANRRIMLIGIDPGSRIGVVLFYADSKLGSFTVQSLDSLKSKLLSAVRRIPSAKVTVRIGDGAPDLSRNIVQMIRNDLPEVAIEVVDESGTTSTNNRYYGLSRDQGAAARIARRKGVMLADARRTP
jgi:hypothetical protein